MRVVVCRFSIVIDNERCFAGDRADNRRERLDAVRPWAYRRDLSARNVRCGLLLPIRTDLSRPPRGSAELVCLLSRLSVLATMGHG